jgi:DNA polymerase-3 subunit gamma/tau
VDLAELWQQILAGLELPSTRMLLNQQAQLVRLDERRAVVRVAGTWMAMVQSRLPLLEKALAGALGSPRQLVLEAGGGGGPGESPSRTTVTANEQRPQPAAAAASMAAPPAAPVVMQPEPPMPAATAEAAATPQPTAATPTPAATATATATVAHGPERAAPSPDTEASNERRAQPSALDEKARRLADFFNGEVISDWDDDVA